MLEQNVQLSADEHYKIFVDFGPQVQSSLPRLAQKRSSLALGQPRTGSSDCGSLEQSKSPVRVTFKKLDHSETRFKQSPEKQAAIQSQMDQESAMCGVYDQFLNNKTVENNHMMTGKDNKSSLNQCLVPISPSQGMQKSFKDRRYNMSESWKAFTLTVEQQNLEEKSIKLKQQSRRVSSAQRQQKMRDQSGLRSQLYKVKGATEQIPREQYVRAGRAQTTMQESQEPPILYGQNHLAVSCNAIQFKQTDTEEISKGENNQEIDVQIMNEDELRLHDEYQAIIHTHSPENKSLAKVEQEHLENTRNEQKRSATMQISSSLDPSNRWLVAPSSNISRLASVSRLHEVDSSKRGNRALSTSKTCLNEQNHLGTNRDKSSKSGKSRKSSCQAAAEEQGFNAESYAAKKKLLSEMIDALESARQVQLKEKSGSRSFGRNTGYNAQSSTLLQPKFSHKEFVLTQKKSVTRKHSPNQHQIRQVTRSSMSKGGMTQLRKSQETSTYLGETWRQKPQSLVTPENNDTIAENQKMMMNTLDARSKNQIMSNFKKLRRIKMPKPKTVDQLIADSLKRNRKVVVDNSQMKVAPVKAVAVENSYCHTEMLYNQSNTNSTAHVNIQDQRIVKKLSKSKVLDARISQDKDVIAINQLLQSEELETDHGLKQRNQQMNNLEPAKSNNMLEIITASHQKQAEFRPSSQSVKSSLQMPFRGSTGTVNLQLLQAKSGTPNEESAVRRRLQKPYKVTVNQDEQRVSSVITNPNAVSTINRKDLVATEYLQSQKEQQTVSLIDKFSKKSDQLDPTQTKMTDKAADEDAQFGELSCSPNFGLQTVEGTVKASSISSHIKLTGLKSKNIQIETPSPVHSEDEDQQEPSFALDKDKLAQAMQDAKHELVILNQQVASIEVQQLTHDEYSKVGDKASKSHKNHRKMLTINYFGNIQDSLIGQIKTKIPISKKHEYARTFHSPQHQNFPDAEAEYKPLVQSLSTNILKPALSGDQQEQPDQRPSSETSQDNNARIFYANIGHEPYIVNKYVRPKGLNSFQLVNNQSEAEMEYQKRKELYMLEQDLKSHYEILQKQKKALRGTMFKDPLTAISKRKSIADLRSNQVLKPSASLPAISVDTSQTTTFRLGEKPPLDARFIKKQKSLIPGGGGSVIVEHAGQIRMQRSQSKIEIASPSLAHKNRQRDGPNKSSVSRRKGYLNFAEREFLETQNLNTQEITLECSEDLVAAAKQKLLPRIRQKQTGQSTPNSAANHSFNSKAMLTEFIKKEASSAAQSPFDMEISMVSPHNADLTRSGIHIEISPKKNSNQINDQNDQQQQRITSASVQSDMQQTANFGKTQDLASQQTGPGETNSRYQPSSSWVPHPQRQMRSSLGENGRETVYSALSSLNNNGEIYIETKITKSPNRKAANSLGVSRTINRPSSKSKSFAGRNSTLSHTVKFGKLNASLCAHSHAEQIKSFIKQRHSEINPPKLLGRGTEKFMGRSSMFKGMPMSSKKQKGLFQNTILANQDQTIIRDSQTISHQEDDDLFNSISHLLPKTNKNKSILKKQLRINQDEYRNQQTGFSQSLRQSAQDQNNVENSTRINGDEIEGELYLRFLKYKNQQTSIDQQTI